MKNKLLVGLLAGLAVVALLYFFSRPDASGPQTQESAVQNTQQKAPAESTAGPTGAQPGVYKDYSAQAVTEAHSAGNKVILFFHAPWCPYCIAADKAFTSRTSELPSGVAILKTDYDSSTELKKKYGVTYQHTFVQIDADGNQITKWTGGDIDNVKKYLK